MPSRAKDILENDGLTLDQIVSVSNYFESGSLERFKGDTLRIVYLREDQGHKSFAQYMVTTFGDDSFRPSLFAEEGLVNMARPRGKKKERRELFLNLNNVDYFAPMPSGEAGAIVHRLNKRNVDRLWVAGVVPNASLEDVEKTIEGSGVSFTSLYTACGKRLCNSRLFVADAVFKQTLEEKDVAFDDVLSVAEDPIDREVVAMTVKGQKNLCHVTLLDFMRRGFVPTRIETARDLQLFSPAVPPVYCRRLAKKACTNG